MKEQWKANKKQAPWLTEFRASVKKLGIKKWDKNLFALESLAEVTIHRLLASHRETLAVSVEGLKKTMEGASFIDDVADRENYNLGLTDAAAHIRGNK